MQNTASGLTRPWIFDLYPGLQKRLPWLPLVDAPTPVHRLESVSAHLGAEVWIKRDDRTSAIYGGNKPRKLEFILAAARDRGCRTLLTGGGLGTNHGLATAIFGKRMNFQVALGLIRQPVTAHVRRNLLLFHAYGAEMRYFSSVPKALLYYYLLERIRRAETHFVAMGGSSPLGTLGYVDAGLELGMQLAQGRLPLPRVIFVAAGTCGTLAGLVLGLKLADVKTRVAGVRVGPGLFSNPRAALGLARSTLKIMQRCDSSVPRVEMRSGDMFVDGRHLGPGYGHPTEGARRAAALMADREGIPLDITYTAKTFGALLEYLDAGPGEGPVLFWDTFNSVDLSSGLTEADYRLLPRPFHRFFEGEAVT